MPRYRLRTLLILLAILPPVLAVGWAGFAEYRAWQAERAKPVLIRCGNERSLEELHAQLQSLIDAKAAEEAEAKAWSDRVDAYRRQQKSPGPLNEPRLIIRS